MHFGQNNIGWENGTAHRPMPISPCKQVNDLTDDVLTKITDFYYSDVRYAVIKELAEL